MSPATVEWDGADVLKAIGLSVAIILGAGAALAAGFFVISDGDFFSEVRILGVPLVILLLGAQQTVFVIAAWRFSISKYRVDSRSLGFVKALGRAPYLKAAAAWLAALAAIALWTQLMSYFGWDIFTTDDSASEVLDFGGGIMLSILVVGLWGPVAEEIFFRGFALAGLRRRFGTDGAVVISSAVFALFHMDPALYIPIFIFGIVLGWLYVKTHSIWPCIVAHSLQNIMALVAAAAI